MNYPNQLDDKNSLFEVKDLGRSSISKPINAIELEIEIDNLLNFPRGRHIVVVESEVIIVSHRIDNILYVEKRGAFDTFADNHVANSKIGVVFTSAHYETLRDTIIDIEKELWTYRKPVIDIINDPQAIIPAENDSYLVDTDPVNEFIGKANNIAIWNGIEWTFIAPQIGFETYVVNKGKYEFNGTSWVLNKDIEISNVNNLQDELDKKVNKVEGKSLVEDTKVTSYDNHLTNEDNPHNVTASQLNVYTKIESNNLLNTKVDKESGKNLVEDTKVSDYDSHLVNTANPHNVTAEQLNVYTKPESDNLLSKKANLDLNNKIPLSEIPDSVLGQLEYLGTHNFNTMPTATEKGQYWICSVAGNGYEVGDWAVYNGTSFDKIDNTDAVSSVAGRTGNVVLNKNDVGLSNVDNTSDLNKPISNATQIALDVKLNKDELPATLSPIIISGQVGNQANVSAGKIPFAEIWVNIGGISYNSTTRRFTVPQSGTYRITMNPFKLKAVSAARVLVGINTDTPTPAVHKGHAYADEGVYSTMSINSVVNLSANDYIVFYLFEGALWNANGDRFNQFTIERIA